MGAYTLAGRIGEGGQGLVFLATAPDGARVAVKLLRTDLAGDEEASVRFVREVELARRVSPFCTAQMIETGLVNGRPYIVSEYIDGPTLADVVRTEGPRSGTSLHRLAIGTVTALVAIHQAGIVHRDFKPSNVVLASDGPRVIDFGIAKALDLTSTLTASAIGTPSFMAPEQFSAGSPGAAADMFAWACTLLYAASGQAPFGQDSVPAVVNRIMNTDADVGVIADPALRSLVADCLAKDPSRRPTAQQALMRLLGQSQDAPWANPAGPGTPAGSFPGGAGVMGGFSAPGAAGGSGPYPGGPGMPAGSLPGGAGVPGGFSGSGAPGPYQGGYGADAAGLLWQGSAAAAGPGHAPRPAGPGQAPYGPYGHGPYPPPMRPGKGRGTGWIVAGAAVATVVLVAAGAFVVSRLALPDVTPTPSPTQAATSAAPTPTPTPTPEARTIRLAATSVELEERSSDPIKLASYTTESGKKLYVRQPGTDRFGRDSRYFEYVLNHDGSRALGTDVDYSTGRKALLSVIDHRTGDRRAIEVSDAPIFPTTPRWSPDGKLALVTLYRATDSESVEYGYGIVDVDAGTARTYEIKQKGAGEWRFFWNSGGDEVGTWVNGRMTFYDLNGGKLRTLPKAGEPVWVEGDDVSPGGDRFLAHCAPASATICAHPTSGDGEADRVPFTSERLIGWWDGEHLAVWRAKGAGFEAVVIDLSGKVQRVLATAPKRSEFDKMAFRFSRGTP